MKGEVVYLYAFDVANEIVPERVLAIRDSKPLPFTIRTEHTFPRDVPLAKPLTIEPTTTSGPGGRPMRVLIRIYAEVGVVSIAMHVPFEVADLPDLLPLHHAVLDNGQPLDKRAQELCTETCKSLAGAMVNSALPSEPEAYTVFAVTEAAGLEDVPQWLLNYRRAIAELLTETRNQHLSETQVNEVMRIQYCYANQDGVVIDWDAAVVVDRSGYIDDVLYVLELANLQLEEYRVMDQRLDKYLNRAYEDVKRRRFGLFGTHSHTLQTLRLLQMDLSRLNDEITHISKFFGDWFLARVYLGARERFHLNEWRSSVEDRLEQLDTLYNVVQAEISNARMLWLEIAIVVLFTIDIWALFFWKH